MLAPLTSASSQSPLSLLFSPLLTSVRFVPQAGLGETVEYLTSSWTAAGRTGRSRRAASLARRRESSNQRERRARESGLIYLDLRPAVKMPARSPLRCCSDELRGSERGQTEDRRVDFAQSHFGMQLNAVQRNTTLLGAVLLPVTVLRSVPPRSALLRPLHVVHPPSTLVSLPWFHRSEPSPTPHPPPISTHLLLTELGNTSVYPGTNLLFARPSSKLSPSLSLSLSSLIVFLPPTTGNQRQTTKQNVDTSC